MARSALRDRLQLMNINDNHPAAATYVGVLNPDDGQVVTGRPVIAIGDSCIDVNSLYRQITGYQRLQARPVKQSSPVQPIDSHFGLLQSAGVENIARLCKPCRNLRAKGILAQANEVELQPEFPELRLTNRCARHLDLDSKTEQLKTMYSSTPCVAVTTTLDLGPALFLKRGVLLAHHELVHLDVLSPRIPIPIPLTHPPRRHGNHPVALLPSASPFACLPVELVHTIISHAACSSPSAVFHLSLVSRAMHKWVEPVLYAAVVINLGTTSNAGIQRDPYAFLQKDPAFISAHVWSLTLTAAPGPPASEQKHTPSPLALPSPVHISRMLPNLTALHLPASTLHLPSNSFLRSLDLTLAPRELTLAPRELTIHGDPGYAAFHWEMSLLATVERLVFWDGCLRHLMAAVPGLTHFACAWTPPPASIGAANAANAVARNQLPLLCTILDLPWMRVLVVHVRGELLTAKELQRLAADMHIADPQVVFVSGSRPGDFMGRSSSSGCEGYEGYGGEGYEWAWAEEALKRGTWYINACVLAKMEV
ncbi:hypothetical protein FIBSPDRAFT_1023264 [Athelia psychrophila]|uniref:F-box domain-containing protein n=1 Tax=Athelia psychrophila TaxID=1759441 RepID=A0A166IP53_9AGAM|nr:hypothetical protein FIBSPDRAFT_1023264 [Fibularhizoctonia sp. CBS 109695]